MEKSVATQKEGVTLICEKIIDKLEPGNLKKACIKVLDVAGQDGKMVLLATKGICSERAMRNPDIRKTIRRIAYEIGLPYNEALNDIRSFIVTQH